MTFPTFLLPFPLIERRVMTDYLTLTEFIPGTKAKAQEINANFSALKDAVNQKAAMEGDSTQTFSVANAIADSHAVNKNQLDNLSDDLTAEINKTGTKFCVKSGNVTNGQGDLFSYNALIITPKIGGAYSNLVFSDYLGTQTIISSAGTISMNGKADGTYNIFIKPDGTFYTLNNTIYRQPARPTMLAGDVWLNTSEDPFNCIKYDGTNDVEFLDMPLGNVTIASSTITAIETFPFNQNGYNINTRTKSYRFPNYSNATNISINTTYTANDDGWLYVETKQYSGGNVYCTINVTLAILLSHENYSQDSSGGLAVLPLCKGNTFRITNSGSLTYFKATFYTVKGASE